ncbi:MAG: hypothetical protein LBK53_08400 [Heliobacteriaceae bacterium]|jgi:hypothetical protein|nr:hypothetical protein [Heliobacteriaceae bacterium]
MSLSVKEIAAKPAFKGNQTQTMPQQNTKKINSTAFTATLLTGLAILGAVGIYIATKGKSGKKLTQTVEPNFPKKQTSEFDSDEAKRIYQSVKNTLSKKQEFSPEIIEKRINPQTFRGEEMTSMNAYYKNLEISSQQNAKKIEALKQQLRQKAPVSADSVEHNLSAAKKSNTWLPDDMKAYYENDLPKQTAKQHKANIDKQLHPAKQVNSNLAEEINTRTGVNRVKGYNELKNEYSRAESDKLEILSKEIQHKIYGEKLSLKKLRKFYRPTHNKLSAKKLDKVILEDILTHSKK